MIRALQAPVLSTNCMRTVFVSWDSSVLTSPSWASPISRSTAPTHLCCPANEGGSCLQDGPWVWWSKHRGPIRTCNLCLVLLSRPHGRDHVVQRVIVRSLHLDCSEGLGAPLSAEAATAYLGTAPLSRLTTSPLDDRAAYNAASMSILRSVLTASPLIARRSFSTSSKMGATQEWMVILPDQPGKLADRMKVRRYGHPFARALASG